MRQHSHFPTLLLMAIPFLAIAPRSHALHDGDPAQLKAMKVWLLGNYVFDRKGAPDFTEQIAVFDRYNIRDIAIRLSNYTEHRRERAEGVPLIPSEEEYNKRRDAEIVAFIKDLKARNCSANIYLWGRVWYYHPKHTYENPGQDYIESLAGLINLARDNGVADYIKGVGANEINVMTTEECRRYALKTTRGVNALTGGFLKDRMFFFPGAGMGCYFKGIDQDGSEFLTEMSAEVKYFSWMLKLMGGHNNDLSKLDRPYKSFATSKEARQYFFDVQGWADLRTFVVENRKRFPNHSHVIYWGDSADALCFADSRMHQIAHDFLVRDLQQKGYCFGRPFDFRSARGEDSKSDPFSYDANTRTVTKKEPLFGYWERWSDPEFSIPIESDAPKGLGNFMKSHTLVPKGVVKSTVSL